MTTDRTCPDRAALIVKGEHYPCDAMMGMTPDSTTHQGWPHSSRAAEAVWGTHRGVSVTTNHVMTSPTTALDPVIVPTVLGDGQTGDGPASLPSYAHPGDAGADLTTVEDVTLPPGGRATIRTNVAIALPTGHVGLIAPRSGLAARHGITILNAPGVIDSGYRGDIRVTLLNTDQHTTVRLHVGERVAQLLVMPVTTAHFQPVTSLPADTARGTGGFGSTGGATILTNGAQA